MLYADMQMKYSVYMPSYANEESQSDFEYAITHSVKTQKGKKNG